MTFTGIPGWVWLVLLGTFAILALWALFLDRTKP